MAGPVNVSTLARLADKDVEQQAQDFGALPLDIRESITRKMAEARQTVVDAAADQIVNLLQAKDAFVVAGAQAVLSLDEKKAQQLALLASVDRATKFGTATQNFLPLAQIMGLGAPAGTKKELLTVPAGWTPATPAAANS